MCPAVTLPSGVGSCSSRPDNLISIRIVAGLDLSVRRMEPSEGGAKR